MAIAMSSGPTSRELRARYGEPDLERFTVKDNIGLTVEYGSDHLACQIIIEKKQQPLLHNEQALTYMAPEVVDELLDTIVPQPSRGPELNQLLESMGCAEGHAVEYENVWIGRYSDMCLPLKPERQSRATVAFKRPECPVSPYARLHQ